MRLALSKADVTGPATEQYPEGRSFTSITVQTRNESLALLTRAGVPILTVKASAVRAGPAPRIWLVDTVEGIYTVSRKPGG